ncbi:selenocysteine-specific translation elongation factor [Aggregatilinea lenta]|uniref:selenocysteine-specific translation elongation factor n=1 Tax=Aggregatilinea lenta TaxID=913108 RepID=UPI000E5A61F2|nr:selenocysteine-specific translation elongation factor [Aggregatilinea lenta]
MHVIGTAGHVDHGKSTLTLALTGINPDRLAEEQAREMTIDLGFAWLDLPGGERVGIVDVPGHRDFIENMLAGVGGIDAAMLVIAADEGVMPQTREHLAILDLLDVPAGLVALTKIDLVDDPGWLDLIQLDILDVTQGTVLDGCPIVPVSARTGEGLDRLVHTLADLLRGLPPRADRGAPRLPVDRVFTISGFGVVVTGTLLGGALSVGQEVEIEPAGVRARIRGLQSHEETVELAGPGRRVAVNVRGVEKDQIRRGDVLGLPGAWHPTVLCDAWLRLLPGAHHPLKHDDPVKIFVGAAEVMGRARVLDRDAVLPGEEAAIQLRLDAPLVAAPGDRFIVRRASPPETIGGGVILDPAPGQRWKRFRPDVIERFRVLREGDPVAVVLADLAQARGPVRADDLPLSPDQWAQALADGQAIDLGAGWVAHADVWARLADQAVAALETFHAAEPLRLGMPREMLADRLRLDAAAYGAIEGRLAAEGLIAAENGAIRLPTHAPRFTTAQETGLRQLWRAVERAPHSPPTYAQACEIAGDAVVQHLIERGELVRLSADVILTPDVLREWIAFTRETLERDGEIALPALRDRFGTTRRYALDFLERLDALAITRRKGDVRVRGSGAWERLG